MIAHDVQQPSAWVSRFAPLIASGGRVLDLACGSGRHTRLLAQRGCRVVALDRDDAALARIEAATVNGAIELLQADMEACPWPFGEAAFDGVVVTNYLHRPLLARLAASLRQGGVLIYETFARGNQRYGRPSNPDFLLAQDELLRAFSPPLAVIAFEQGRIDAPAPAVVQRICAVRTTDCGAVSLPSAR